MWRKNKMKKQIPLLMLGIILMSLVMVSAYTPHKQGTDWNIVFDDANATSCNITTINYPDGSYDYINSEMDKTGNTFNYTISGENLTTLGDTCSGVVCYNPSASPQYDEGSVCIETTQTGISNEKTYYLVFIGIAILLGMIFLIVSFIYDDYMMIFSAIGFITAGVFVLYFPLGETQTFITQGISILLNGIGLVIIGAYVIRDWLPNSNW